MANTSHSHTQVKLYDESNHCTTKTVLNNLMLPFLPGEEQWDRNVKIFLYGAILAYTFIGVAIASDIFMSSIEYIVSKSKSIPFDIGEEENRRTVKVDVRIWNPTVANLTLLALGSSAPEILLSVIEASGSHFESTCTDLGPGTIVGSAAYNLLIITAVCIMAVPKGEVRRIEMFNVFMITTIFSLFAYIWIWLVLSYITPKIVDIWEAVVTLICFPLLVLIAWWADNTFCVHPKKNVRKSLWQKANEIEMATMQDNEGLPGLLKGDPNPLYVNDQVNPNALLKFYKEIRENAELTNEEAASLVAYKLVQTQQHSRLWYRMGACRVLMGSAKVTPVLNEKLQEVYNIINKAEKNEPNLKVVKVSPEILHAKAVFEFQAAGFSVPENIGTLNVVIIRTGKADNQVELKIQTIDGTAKAGTDYEKVDQKVVFEPFVMERVIPVNIIDDNQWEPDESFFLRLTLSDKETSAMLGQTHTMEITIVDDDNPGVFSFAKRGQLVSETLREVPIEVSRTSGCDGVVIVKWKTIPDPSGGVKHPNAMTGRITFKHGEKSKCIHVPLFQENNEKPSETFDVELTGTNVEGAKLGKINKTSITISDEAAFQDTVNKVVEMAAAEMDIIGGANLTIGKQLVAAFQVADGEETATRFDYVMHFISLPWKVLLALIPPASMGGGYPCFVISLAAIGLLTAIIGDIATVFGCLCGLPPTITAITFVALGTSLPDTFASMAAASHDDSADNAIGNVTGSNSVNVFLGLGLPWVIGAIYHACKGSKYEIEPGDLSFSVIIYTIVAIASIVILVARRYLNLFGKAELGGTVGPKFACGIVLIGFWILYVALSWLQAEGQISNPFEKDTKCKDKESKNI